MDEKTTQTLQHVRIGTLMGEVKYADVPNGTTLREAFLQAGVSTDKEATDILLNDVPVDLDTVLNDLVNPVVTLLPAVEAGC